ncbi:MAG: hypothetical protein JWM05_2062, partial [Acidimicrobiales bacterium]|nr:hypothetical protein [Acidimicrobiales bacterium]
MRSPGFRTLRRAALSGAAATALVVLSEAPAQAASGPAAPSRGTPISEILA